MQYQQRTPFKPLSRVILLILIVGLLNGCGSIPVVNYADTIANNNNNNVITVEGFIVDSDGATPVFGATVAMLTENMQAGKNIEQGVPANCVSPIKPYQSYTCTKEDGSFVLNLSAIQYFPATLSVEKGGQSREITLTKEQVMEGLGSIVLTTETSQDKDKVAVVMDFYNPIDEIKDFLSDNPSQLQSVKLQLMNEYQTLYQISGDDQDVSYPTFYSLFADEDSDGKADIFKYDVVYINSRDQSDIALLDESIRKKLLAFINNGGRLYVTEWTVELEQEEPSLDQYI